MKQWVQEIRVVDGSSETMGSECKGVEGSSETMGSVNKRGRGKQSNNGFRK